MLHFYINVILKYSNSALIFQSTEFVLHFFIDLVSRKQQLILWISLTNGVILSCRIPRYKENFRFSSIMTNSPIWSRKLQPMIPDLRLLLWNVVSATHNILIAWKVPLVIHLSIAMSLFASEQSWNSLGRNGLHIAALLGFPFLANAFLMIDSWTLILAKSGLQISRCGFWIFYDSPVNVMLCSWE